MHFLHTHRHTDEYVDPEASNSNWYGTDVLKGFTKVRSLV